LSFGGAHDQFVRDCAHASNLSFDLAAPEKLAAAGIETLYTILTARNDGLSGLQ